MAGPTEEQHDYMHQLTGKNPRDFAVPAAGAVPWTFNPVKPKPISLTLDPDKYAAQEEAAEWVKAYLKKNRVDVAPNAPKDGPDAQIMFNGKPTKLDIAIGTAVAAGKLADLKTGDQGRLQINPDLVSRLIKEMLAPVADIPPSDDPGPAAAKKGDDDSVDTSVEVTPKKAETQIKITVKLLAQPDDKRAVVLLPDVEITLHIGKDATSSSVEAQLNLVKIQKDVSARMRVNGHVIVKSIEFTVGVSGEANMTQVALMRIKQSLEVKMKAELEFKITDHISFSLQAEAGKDGMVVGPALTYHF